MEGEKKDFKAVKVNIKSGTKNVNTISRSMLYSGVNIFGQLTEKYLKNKEEIIQGGGSLQQAASAAPQGDAQPEMMSLPQEVLMIFKRVQKKDPVTKCKALRELDEHLDKVEKYSEEHYSVTTIFLYHYCRIQVNEADKKVREAAQCSLGKIIEKGTKTLAPHMSKVFPIWFCSFFDSCPEVAQLGQKNFKTAFKENGDRVFKISFQYFLHFADENLKQSEDQLAENTRDLNKQQKADNYDRIISSILQALAESFEFVQKWTDEDRQYYIKKLVSYLDLKKKKDDQESKESKKKKSEVATLWLFMTQKYRGKIRSSCMMFVSKFLKNVPHEVAESHIEQLGPLIFEMVAEDNSIVQSTLWKEAYPTIGKEFPQVWELISLKKAFIPGLLSCLKNSGFGATFAFYPNIVRFVSVFPLFHFFDFSDNSQNKFSLKDRSKFVTQFYTHLFAGLKNDEASNYHRELTGAYFETLTFFIIKRFLPFAQKLEFNFEDEGLSFAWGQLQMVLELPEKDYIAKHEKFKSKVQNQRNLRSTIPERYRIMVRDLTERNLDERLLSKIVDVIFDSFADFGQFSDQESEKNAVRFAKVFASNNLINGRLVKKIYDGEMQSEIKDIGRKTLEMVVTKAKHLTKFLRCMTQEGIQQDMITVSSALELIKSLDEMQQRNANRLDAQDIDKIESIKEQLVLISMMALGKENMQEPEFFKYLLLEGKSTPFTLQKMILFPNSIPKVDQRQIKQYSETLGKNSSIVCDFINSSLLPDICTKSIYLRDIFTNDILSKDQSNNMAKSLLASFDHKNSHHYLKAAEHILQSNGQFEEQMVKEWQKKLIESILSQESNSKNEELWQILRQIIIGNESLLETGKELLKSKLQKTISEITSYQQVEIVQNLTETMKEFVQLCESSSRQAIVEYVLLSQENFKNCEKNCLPMKIFRDMFLKGGISFDIASLLENKSYTWLASTLLNIKNMSSLNNLPDLKRQLSLFLDIEVIPSLLVSVKNGNKGLLMELIQDFKVKISDKNDSCLSTLENLISKLVDPGEDFGSEPLLMVDDFKQIFEVLSKEKAQNLLDKKDISQTDVKLMCCIFNQAAYYILDEPVVSALMKLAKKNLHIDMLTKADDMQQVAYSIQIYLSLYKHFTTDYDSELQEVLLQWLIGNFSDTFYCSTSHQIFQLSVILNFLASMMDYLGVNKFNQIITFIPEDTLMVQKQQEIKKLREERQEEIQKAKEKAEEVKLEEYKYEQSSLETLILQVIKVSNDVTLDPQATINLLTLIRKVLPGMMISQKQFVIDEIIEMAKEKVVLFDQKLKKFVNAEEDQLEIEYQEEEMLAAFAETIMTSTLYINEQVSENSLYILINSGFGSLQKAAFYMLTYLYENHIPTVLFIKDEDQEMQQLQTLAQAEEEQKSEEPKEEKAKEKFEFKNVPQVLVDIIENPPNVQEALEDSETLESLIFGHTKEGCLSKEAFGYMLTWSSLLKKIDYGRIKAQLADRDDYTSIIGTITEYLEQNTYIYEMLLVIIVAYLPKVKRVQMVLQELQDFEPAQMVSDEKYSSKLMSLYTLVGFMKSFPSLARKYYQNCDKQLLDIVMPYIKQMVSPAILDNEIQKIEISQITLNESGQGEGLTFSLFKSTKEIVAEYTKGEVSMQLKIMIPIDYPMKSVVVEVGQQLKITERQKNKWVLAIKNLLQLRNGDIISAVLLWKNNIDKEIEGVEDCFICYCVLHPTDKSLPKMPCKHCKNKFHVACVRKWFKTSNKSNCPLCQQYFF